MKKVVVTLGFAGPMGTFGPSEEPQEMSDDLAEMIVRAGFGQLVVEVPAKQIPAAKPKPKAKAKK